MLSEYSNAQDVTGCGSVMSSRYRLQAIAETILRFIIRKLEELKTPLAEELAAFLRKRIVERRTNLTACLLYIRDPAKYQADKEFEKDETFKLPPKNVIRTEIKSLIERLHPQHSLIHRQIQIHLGRSHQHQLPPLMI